MKIGNTFFFQHCSAEFLLSRGWDFSKTPVEDWVEEHKATLEAHVCFSLADNTSVTEYDIAMAGQGHATEAFIKFWTTFAAGMYPEAKDEYTVLQSMHSGSSAYLTAKDIREMVKSA